MLRASLHSPYEEGKDVEVGGGLHKVAADGDSRVAEEADEDGPLRADDFSEFPKSKSAGMPTNWVMRMAATRSDISMPISLPTAVAILMIVRYRRCKARMR